MAGVSVGLFSTLASGKQHITAGYGFMIAMAVHSVHMGTTGTMDKADGDSVFEGLRDEAEVQP